MNRVLIPVLLLAACSVQDADVTARNAITTLGLTVNADSIQEREVTLEGAIGLGYTSRHTVELTAWDNGVEVLARTYNADNLELAVSEVLPLLDEGTNALVVEAEYLGQTRTTSLEVQLPAGVQALSLTPSAPTVSSFLVDVTGEVELGFVSDQPGILEIAVNGEVVYAETFDASVSTTLPLSLTLPLTREGDNDVAATFSHGEAEYETGFAVAVEPPNPTVSFPSWTETYTPAQGLVVDGNLDVSVAAPHQVDAVWTSLDGLFWTESPPATGTLWRAALQNPDIGRPLLHVRVQTSHRGYSRRVEFVDGVTVEPRFDCATPTASMLPTVDFNEALGTEQRTVLGYFGDPGHAWNFVVVADVPGDGTYRSVAEVVRSGNLTQDLAFNVNGLDCGAAPCALDYDLEVWVDGTRICTEANFGRIVQF